MAKEVAIGKRAKISEAQQIMLMSVIGASVFLGAAISICLHFINQISFNAEIISKEDESIVAYSSAIKQTGICKKPSGDVYTIEELQKCNPDSINVSDIPGTLRSNIIEDLAANEALGSVSTGSDRSCINPSTGKDYTFSELTKLYNPNNKSEEENAISSKLMKACSALRVIPDALPAYKNDEALLASLNKIFNISNWTPESLSPGGSGGTASFGKNLKELSVNLSIKADSATTNTVLNNIERSIRDFNIKNATISWDAEGLELHAQATSYYMDESSLNESTKTIKANGGKK